MMSLHEAAPLLAARVAGEGLFSSVGTDSRTVQAGQLFVALRGDRFDGHDFVRQAIQAGAGAALVDADWAALHSDAVFPLLVVADTRQALGMLSGAWRRRFSLPLIGITGSNGKTTVKEMCASVLRAWMQEKGLPSAAVLATSGNFNNDIGLPLTLLALTAQHRAAVVEMGMNHPGEIAYLTRLAAPTVALVNNAQRAHLQGLGTLSEVAREKGAIYDGLGDDGIAIVNADDTYADQWRMLNAGRQVISFGLESNADVRGQFCPEGLGTRLVLETPYGRIETVLHLPGKHNVRNAVGTAAACLAAGVSLSAVAAGLSACTGAQGRLQPRIGLNGAVILDDSYNANPDSVRAGIDVLVATPGRKLLVLGDMGELGQTSAQVHDEIGGYAKSKGVDGLYALGEMSAIAVRNFGEGGVHFSRLDELIKALESQLDSNSTVLVKGSRFMRMERVVDRLVVQGNTAHVKDAVSRHVA